MKFHLITLLLILVITITGCVSPTPVISTATLEPIIPTLAQPTATQQPPTLTPTIAPTFTSTPEVISIPFQSDFEDNTMHGFDVINGEDKAKIVKDETGNMVLEVVLDEADMFQASYGPQDIRDFDLTFRTRFIKIPFANKPIAQFSLDEQYSLFPVAVFGGFAVMEYKENSTSSSSKLIYRKQIEPNVWYKVHLVSQGKKIVLSLDDGKTLSTTIKEITNANLGIEIFSTADIQFDDFVIIDAKK